VNPVTGDFYKTVDHTADVGIEVEAPDPAGLFRTAALAMLDLMFGGAGASGRNTRRIEVEGEDDAELMVAWLNEILYLCEVEGMVFADFLDIRRGTGTFSATGAGEIRGPDGASPETEIKAATYHGLIVEKRGDRWFGRIIFDV
jgi:SHS2 domain-containing protein